MDEHTPVEIDTHHADTEHIELTPELLHEHAKLLRYKPKNCCERYCCGGLINMPCGYPPGTVRAIVTIVIVSVVIMSEAGVLVYAAINKDTTLLNIVITVLSNSITAVISFYFGTRSSSKESPQKKQPSLSADVTPA